MTAATATTADTIDPADDRRNSAATAVRCSNSHSAVTRRREHVFLSYIRINAPARTDAVKMD